MPKGPLASTRVRDNALIPCVKMTEERILRCAQDDAELRMTWGAQDDGGRQGDDVRTGYGWTTWLAK